MTSFSQIENEIKLIKEFDIEAGNKLNEQLHHSIHGTWDADELEQHLKSDEDVADLFFSDNESLHADVRNIQDAIINL